MPCWADPSASFKPGRRRAGPTGTGPGRTDPPAFLTARGKGRPDWDRSLLGRPFCLLCNKGEKPVRLGPVPVGRTLQPSLKQGGEAGPNGTGHGRADPSALFKARGKGRPGWDWSRSDRPLCLLESKGEWPVGLGLSWSDWAFCRSAFLMARQKRCSPGRGPPPPPAKAIAKDR